MADRLLDWIASQPPLLAYAILMLLSAVDALPGDRLRWGIAGVTFFLLGWMTLAVTGQAYKVTPFLMWYYRFHLGLPAIEVPRLAAPYWPRTALALVVLLGVLGQVAWVGLLWRLVPPSGWPP